MSDPYLGLHSGAVVDASITLVQEAFTWDGTTLEVDGEVGSVDGIFKGADPDDRLVFGSPSILEAHGSIDIDIDSDNDQTDRVFRVTHNGGTELARLNETGQLGLGVVSPTSRLHLPAGATGAGLGSLKIDAGSLLSVEEEGAVEFAGEDLYITLNNTGGGRKRIVLEDDTLTEGRIPIVGENGRLEDSSGLIWTGTRLEATNLLTRNLLVQTAAVGFPCYTYQSPATNDDPSWSLTQYRLATTSGSTTTIATIAIPTNSLVVFHLFCWARRTGGTAGANGDSFSQWLPGYAYKNVGGTVSLVSVVGSQANVLRRDQPWGLLPSISGTNVLIGVIGAANNNITWHLNIWRNISLQS